MKIYIPSATKESDFKYPMEMFSIVPYINEQVYSLLCESNGVWNDGIFSKLFLTPSTHERVDEITHSDCVIIPFKYSADDIRIVDICNHVADKPVICFFCDDSAEKFNTPKNLILFRTSLYKSTHSIHERAMPVLIPDHKPDTLSLPGRVHDDVITYCGHVMHNRDNLLHKLQNIYKSTNIITRNGFWAPGLPKIQARREYYNNLMSGSMTFCSRGGGNFSYRFYEALSFGRIPILIDTDCLLPFEYNQAIKWHEHIIRINENTFMQMNESEFINLLHECSSLLSPKWNRELWETMLSPEGFFKNLIKDI